MTHTVKKVLWMLSWTAFDQTSIMESMELSSHDQHTSSSSVNIPQCPLPCDNDPCECALQQVGKCMMNSCTKDGCNQCYPGYFKKDYNYPCVGCNDTFGSDCLYCSDFLGCVQCSHGVQTYDDECGLHFCNPTTIEESTRQESSDDVDTVNKQKSLTPAPTQSPTEEEEVQIQPLLLDFEDELQDRIAFDLGCVSHFSVDSVSEERYSFLVETYFPVQENHGEFESLSGNVLARVYVKHLHDFDRSSLIFFTNDGFVIGRENSYVSKKDTTNLSPFVGSHTFYLLSSNKKVFPHVHITLNIQVYTCDLELVEPRCCIFVNGMVVNQETQLGQYLSSEMDHFGGNKAFNGEYCNGYNVKKNIFIHDQTSKENKQSTDSDIDYGYNYYHQAMFSINDNNYAEFTWIAVDFVFDTKVIQYKATYSIPMSQKLACNIGTQSFNHFFRAPNIKWIYSIEGLKDITDTKVKLKPHFDLSHCMNKDLWCHEVIRNGIHSNQPLVFGFWQLSIAIFTFDVLACICVCNLLEDRCYRMFLTATLNIVAMTIVWILQIIFPAL